MLKKSEFIREAVDKFLSPVYGVDTYQLCLAVNRVYYADGSEEASNMRFAIHRDIEEALGDRLTMNIAFDIAFPDADHHADYVKEAQNLRFMFAEFLALMYEDEEAEAEWKAEVDALLSNCDPLE